MRNARATNQFVFCDEQYTQISEAKNRTTENKL